ncbi:hypothetical protein ACFRCG_03055 [Embleya sp. NPDC056575]|uniref:hypothetical protein n=1 Tax=unclassified Embleya TaxID=2699296 RepID=UPI003687C5CB
MTRTRFTTFAAVGILIAVPSLAWADGGPSRAEPTITQVQGPAVTLQARQVQDLPRLFCPQGSTSTGGGVRLDPDNGAFLQSSNPAGPGWDLTVDNLSDGPRTVTPVVVCTTDPTITHQVGNRVSGSTLDSQANCPAGQTIAGGGAMAGRRNYLSLSSGTQSEYWLARAKNVNTTFAGVVAFARCSGLTHTYRTSLPVAPLQAGEVGSAHAECPAGQVPSAGGGLGDPNLLHNASFPTATGWTLRATNTDNVPRSLIAVAVCAAP